jgi:CubicO group peptidase (beta-lactamase class C family)
MKPRGSRTASVASSIATILLIAALQSTTIAGDTPRHTQASGPQPWSMVADSSGLIHLLDSLIVPGLSRYHIPGMVVVIVRDSSVILAKGYGYADVERKVPFDPHGTVIRIASVSKLFTATAVLQLADRGKLDMHQDINAYLTRFKVRSFGTRPITLQHLLTHTAGFDERTVGKSSWTAESQPPLGDFLAARLPPAICPPGEVFTYSNFSNALAGFVVEEVTGEDFAAYVRKHVLDPLGMSRSDYRLRPDLRPLLAQCYSHAGTGFNRQPFDFINDYPGGQMLSTGTDMARFMIAHLQLGRYAGTRILDEATARAMHTAQFTHHPAFDNAMGYGFGIHPARSQTILMHDGGYTGVGSRLCLCPGSGIGFFVACNIMDGRLLDEVSKALLDGFIPPEPADTSRYPLAVPPSFDKSVGEFSGAYRFTRYSHTGLEKAGVLLGMAGPEMSIGQNGEGMILMPTFSGKPRRMIQSQPGVFTSIDDKYLCAFRRDESGRVAVLFTNGTTAFEKLAWYETVSVQRILFVACVLWFAVMSMVVPAIRRIRKAPKRRGLDVDPVGWFARKVSSTFLFYILGLGIVIAFVIPPEELALGFAHGMHWTMYVVQTIPLAGVLFVAGLCGVLFWGATGKRAAGSAPLRSVGPGLTTAVAGIAFVWFLWYWNLLGYNF